MSIPRLVIAGATSGVGKTTVSIAIMNSLREKGYTVQPFKVGPDFIDPSYHTLITRRASRNLDAWMMGERGIRECFARTCEGADLAVIEGVMGLFDGMSGRDSFASTAHVARLLKAPIILVVDASKGARSIAAIIFGFIKFERGLDFAGVILNNVASARHAGYLAEAIDSKLKCPVLGIIQRDRASEMEERHLGLVPTMELKSDKQRQLVHNSRRIAEQLDMEKIERAFGEARLDHNLGQSNPVKPVVRIAVALDESFNFYYQDNLDALRMAGGELEFFSPVADAQLPRDVNGLILGGGFPEVLADALEKNSKMAKSLQRAVYEEMPVYAECGGLMYLSRSIRGYKGSSKKHKMLGVVEGDIVMTGRLTLNYTEAACDGPVLGKALLRGHEFHYSELHDFAADTRFAYSLSRGKGIADGQDGIVICGNGLASYTHLHFGGNNLAKRLVDSCLAYSKS